MNIFFSYLDDGVHLIPPADAKTVEQFQAALIQVAELTQAIELGHISLEQFQHVVEILKQLKLAFLLNRAPKEKDAPTL